MRLLPSKGIRQPLFVRFESQDTRRNLPATTARKRIEASFLRSFEKAYFAAEAGAAVAGRELELHGFGRADLVWVVWSADENPNDFTALALKKRVRLTAIEAKMSDWRKGLQQAFRYRYFAHRSLLVLPLDLAIVAARFLDTFRQLRVGLWGFEVKTSRLHKWFTPRYFPPIDCDAFRKALRLIESSLEFGQFAKRL